MAKENIMFMYNGSSLTYAKVSSKTREVTSLSGHVAIELESSEVNMSRMVACAKSVKCARTCKSKRHSEECREP